MNRQVLALCAVAFLIAAFVAFVPLGGMPHLTDEVAYTLQSKLFAQGLRTGPPADNASMVQYPFWVAEPRSYAVFPPGWPALLGFGEAVGLASLVNPLLCGVLPLLSYLLAKELVPEKTALLAAGVMALSPGVWLLGATRMAHTSVLVALLVAAVVVVRKEQRGWAWWAAGAALAYVVTARQFDAVLAIPLIVMGRRLPLLILPGLAGLLVLVDNAALTGDPYVFPVNAWFDEYVQDWNRGPGCNRMGFGADIGCHATFGDWGHTPAKAWRIFVDSGLRLDRLLLGVPGGSLLVAAGAWMLRRRVWPWLLLPWVIGGYALYWSPGAAYGARFWHPLYIVLPLLVAVPLHALLKHRAWLVVGVVPLVGGSFLVNDLADRFWCVDRSVSTILESEGIEEGVVFLHGAGLRETGWPALGVPEFVCDASLEAGDGLWLNDPGSPSGGLQIRHALVDDENTRAYLDALHPGESAWILGHDVSLDRREVRRIH
jgi:hypothetical protein